MPSPSPSDAPAARGSLPSGTVSGAASPHDATAGAAVSAATAPAAGVLPPFHLAFPVRDVNEARQFYGGLLQCPEGRSAPDWVDFNFFGHQIVAHLAPQVVAQMAAQRKTNVVDGDHVPVPHFGAVLPMAQWQHLADRLRDAGIEFVIEPHVRFKGEVGEQATMFFLDPSGNALELKSFNDLASLFAK